MGSFLANSPLGGLVKTFVGLILGSFVAWLASGRDLTSLTWSDAWVWISAALVVVIPVGINLLNGADTRYGRVAAPAGKHAA